MNSSKQIITTILNLNHEQFFQDDKSLLSKLDLSLSNTDFIGIAVNAPKKIKTDTDNELPFYIATRKTGIRDWQVSQEKNCILTATDLNMGDVYFAEAFPDIKGRTHGAQPQEIISDTKPSDLPLFSSKVYRIDAQNVLALPWNSGKFALAAISYDWPSNSVEVELIGDKKPEKSQAKEVFPPPNPNAGATEKRLFGLLERQKQVFPSYIRSLKIPKPPDKIGLSFKIEEPKKANRRLFVYGVFVCAAKQQYLPDAKISHRYADGKIRNVAAVVPMTFAIVGVDWPVPERYDWAVPAYSDREIQQGQPVIGFFSIDVFDGMGQRLPEGNYAAFIIMDGVVYGPQKFRLSE